SPQSRGLAQTAKMVPRRASSSARIAGSRRGRCCWPAAGWGRGLSSGRAPLWTSKCRRTPSSRGVPPRSSGAVPPPGRHCRRNGPMRRILVISPHPDDESIGCGGALRKHALRGDEVRVVFLTSGEKGGHGRPLEETARARELEAATAAAILGLAGIEFW